MTKLCDALQDRVRGYTAWKRGGSPTRRRLTDVQMLVQSQSIHKEFKGAYAAPEWSTNCVLAVIHRARKE